MGGLESGSHAEGKLSQRQSFTEKGNAEESDHDDTQLIERRSPRGVSEFESPEVADP